MKLFVPVFLLALISTLVLVFVPESRPLVKKYFLTTVLAALAVAAALFLLFTAMSLSSWRLF